MGSEINLISEIKEAEKRAGEIIAAAREEGEAMVEKIRNEYREKAQLAESRFRDAVNDIAKRAAAEAENVALRMSEDAEREISVIRESSKERIRYAADLLVKKILE